MRPSITQAAAFLITGFLLTMVQLMMDPAGLMLERFVPGGGWAQAVLLALYAAWLVGRLGDRRTARLWRPRLWALFSAVFFGQLILGLAGFERLLMTGHLHLPVPALVAAGPVYRGGGLFMPILFASSLLLVGPAWCSWLCYIGAWDDAFARRRKRPQALPRRRGRVRLLLLVVVLATAFGLGRNGAPAWLATVLAAALGLVGVGVMAVWSRRTGAMTHCTAYCPLGWLATRLGRLSPFRIRIGDGCTDCGACNTACRFDALSAEDVLRRRPAESCTLCGDCLATCKGRDIGYRFGRLAPGTARTVFLVLAVSLHAAFLGVARI
jgi:hypothetical protein